MPTAQRRTGRTAPADPAPAPAAPERTIRTAAARARGAAQQIDSVATVTNKAYGSETAQQEVIQTNTFPAGVDPSFVRVSASKTINMGDYNSLRIEVSYSQPCLHANREDAFLDTADFVAEKLLEEEREWLGSTQPKPKANRR